MHVLKQFVLYFKDTYLIFFKNAQKASAIVIIRNGKKSFITLLNKYFKILDNIQ